jgi:inosine triphosphate pyrophosphatase
MSGNQNKLNEVQQILGPYVKNIISKKIDLEEVQGDPVHIIKHKVKQASGLIDMPVLVEDTSLCFNALNGMPGPYVKWFHDKIGNEGLHNLLAAYKDKSCKAICMFGYMKNKNDEPLIFIGECDGIVVPPNGDNKFGWDPIFQPLHNNPNGRTFATMADEEKNKISHRYLALHKLREYFD